MGKSKSISTEKYKEFVNEKNHDHKDRKENRRKNMNRAAAVMMTGVLAASNFTTVVNATSTNTTNTLDLKEKTTKKATKEAMAPQSGYTFVSAVNSVSSVGNVVTIDYVNGEKARVTFLEPTMYRFNLEPDGKDSSFLEYAKPRSNDHIAHLVQQSDGSNEYSKPTPTVTDNDGVVTIETSAIRLTIDKSTSMMKLENIKTGKVVWEETAPIQYGKDGTIQSLKEDKAENFYGGGTQNGRFAHKGKIITMDNGGWVDGQVSSPNPFYWSTAGYGMVRNTFMNGKYDFGKTTSGTVTTQHDENRYDAYVFVGENPTSILDGYWKITGSPALIAENSFYMAHLNCYNRDEWKETSSGGNLLEDGKRYTEKNNHQVVEPGWTLESLNGTNDNDYKFSARAVIDGYVDNDMPFGWFAPNDGYGCGYGQDRNSLDNNVANLKEFSDYAAKYGVNSALWTQSDLTPNPNTEIMLQRDFKKEVNNGGVRSLKTDVAWVGPGYSFALNGVKYAYDTIAETKERPTIVTLNGWAGTQRYGGIWTGDQYGGNWEYIRFHIPSYIGQSLSGNPNVSSDVDGIFGGSQIIQTRDIQWKSFTTMMLDMDGWGSFPKKPYIFGEDTTSINRMYLKLRAQLMPYIYTTAYTSSNFGTDASEKGKPQVRAMFLEFPEDPNTYGTNVQYQFMMGKNLLVAPVYQNTAADKDGNDIRNDIYLPDNDQIWIDYFTGKQYQGGRSINNFDAPIWKMPLFVKNGAILPMYEDNNNAMAKSETNTKGLDKTKRIVEFYPDKTQDTYYDLFEDDGKSIDNTNVDQPTYGSTVSTHFTSSVKSGTATLKADKSVGSYTGYNANRDTTFVVNVSKEPTSINAKVGGKALAKADFKVVTSQEEFDKATGNTYFYNPTPNLNKYATEGSDFADKEISTTPKLFVKFAKTDVNANAIELNVAGFINDGNLDKNEINNSLSAPTGLAADVDSITPTEIGMKWNSVAGATGYEIETDGIVQSSITKNSYTHTGLEYHSKHTYRVRAVNADGYSKWSDPVEVQSALDPYRNVPKDMEISFVGGDAPAAYGGKFTDIIDGDDTTEYSSKDGGAWTNQSFIIDMKKIFSIEKLEYLFRENGGNGAVSKFGLAYSNDNINWTEMPDWSYKLNEQPLGTTEIYRTATLNIDTPISARYIKFTVKASTGGFLQSYEIRPYKVDGTEGRVVGDTNGNGVVDEGDITQIENYVGLEEGDAAWDQVKASDWNNNKYFDASDITFTTTQVNGGVKNKTGDPEGGIRILADKKTVKAGETVSFNVFGANMKNVYAYGIKLPYSNEDFAFDTITPAYSSVNMKQFSFDRAKVTLDGTLNRNVNVVFSALGEQTTINGTQSLTTITLKAKKDMTIDTAMLDKAEVMLVANNLVAINAAQIPSEPEIPEASIAKITGIQATTTHEDYLQSGMGVGKLVDGGTGYDTAMEFKWGDSAETCAPATLPFDVTFTLPTPKKIDTMKVYGGGRAAQVKDFELYGTVDGVETLIGTYTLPADKNSVDIKLDNSTVYSSLRMNCTSSKAGVSYKLSINEVEFYENSTILPTDITFDESNVTTLNVNRMAPFSASVTPKTATNKYYDLTSSDESIVKVIKTSTKDGYSYAIVGVKAGKATLTATTKGKAANGETISKQMEVNVVDGVYTADLETLVANAKDLLKTPQLFTKESVATLEEAVVKAGEALDAKANQATIDAQVIAMNKAINGLAYKGSLESQPDSEAMITNPDMKLLDFSSQATESPATNVIDGDTKTFWHSSYATGKTLPQSVTVDLGSDYDLYQVNYLPRQDGSKNGDITRYQIEVSSDGENFTPVVQGTFDSNSSGILDRSELKKVKFEKTEGRYVRFIALESLGNTNNSYCSAAELQFFGRKSGEQVPATNVVVDKTEIKDMKVNSKVKLNANVEPFDSTDELHYTSSDEDVVTVNAYGEIQAVGLGEATITISAVGNTRNAGVSIEIPVVVDQIDAASLSELIDESKLISYEDKNVQDALNAEITNAQKVLTNSSEDGKALADAYKALRKAIADIKVINDDIEAIKDYADVDMSKYETNADAIAFTKLVTDTKTLLSDPMTNAKAIAQAHKDLTSAFAKLAKLNLEDLAAAINTAKAIDLGLYVDNDALATFKTTLANAQALQPKTNKEIQDMINKLSDDANMLVRKATSEQLQAIEDAKNLLKGLDVSKYSEEDQQKIKDGITAAEAALKNATLSSADAESLLAELHGLLDLQPIIPNLPENPGDNKPGGNNGSGNTQGGQAPGTSDTNKGMAGMLSVLGLSGFAAWIAARKKRKNSL